MITTSYKLLIIMVKKENKIFICNVAGGKHIATTLSIFLLVLKAFSSFLKEAHVFFSTQGWGLMQGSSMMHPTQSQTLTDVLFPDLRPLGHLASMMLVPLSSKFGCMLPHASVSGTPERQSHMAPVTHDCSTQTLTQKHVH